MTLSILFGSILVCATLHAQPYDLRWHTIAGGGGASNGGAFALSGTIGQPEAASMSDGSYTIDGGFWTFWVNLQPLTPLLSITLDPRLSSITVSWPLPASDWRLQENRCLDSADWIQVAQTPQEVDGHMQWVVELPTDRRFYRLFKPGTN
ncbi:MAG TPA: hypothetical protein PKM73_17945 [Verrucomicrobiota bacterium]|nr:hypothetical protein [Verrucomicrobiota bacterium]HNU52083.1 hypothetical protein [Verrucomicrobiota bacterium]